MKINYDEIDEKCIPMVKFFNDVGLETIFSCQGHDVELNNSFEIIFSDVVSDDKILSFLLRFDNIQRIYTPLVGDFSKWTRKVEGEMFSNWIYSVGFSSPLDNQRFAKDDLETMKRVFRK